MGLNPITLDLGLADEVVKITERFSDRCDRTKVLPSSFWNKARADAAKTDSARLATLNIWIRLLFFFRFEEVKK